MRWNIHVIQFMYSILYTCNMSLPKHMECIRAYRGDYSSLTASAYLTFSDQFGY